MKWGIFTPSHQLLTFLVIASGLYILSSKNDSCLFDDLNWANHHLTCFSRCAVESLTFNLKSAVFGYLANEIYSEEIESKELIHLKECSFNELSKWLLNNVNNISNGQTRYISNKFPDPNLFK